MSLIFKQLFERESCTYTYLIADSLTKEAAIIDAVDIMIERDTALLKELELDLKFIIETHIHADHITSACPLKKYYPNAWLLIEGFIESYLNLLKMQYAKGMSEGIYTKPSIELLLNIDKIFVLQVVTNFSLFNDQKYQVHAIHLNLNKL